MGAVCCNPQVDDPLLSLSASTMLNQLDPRVSVSSSAPTSQSLANYVSFSFPFTFSSSTVATQPNYKKKTRTPDDNTTNKTQDKSRDVRMPYVELSCRSLCAQLLVHPQQTLETVTMPPEVALKVLQWLRQHYLLDKKLFQALAPFLLLEWNLVDQVEVQDAWFDEVPATTFEKVRHINMSGCIHLQDLGSARKHRVRKLPNLVSASFQNCAELSSASIEMLSFSTKLTALNLSGCENVDNKTLRKLCNLNQLKSLQLTGCCKLTDKGIQHLSLIPKLEKLQLGCCRKLTDDAFEAPLNELRELDVRNCRLTDKAMQHIGRLRSLETLVIRGCQQVSDDAMKLLTGLKKLKYFDARHCRKIHSVPLEWTQLQVLLLGYTAFAEADSAVLQYLTDLQELELRRCQIMKRGFQFISRLCNLERLDLGETPLTDAGLLEICDGVRKLKALNISDTEISDTGTTGLAKLRDLRILHMDTQGITSKALKNVAFLLNMEKLDLFGANISDNGLSYLVRLHHLQELTICGGKISDRGVGMISNLLSLTSLNLSQNRNIRTKSLFYLRSLTGLRCLNLSNTSISAPSLRHLSPLKELESLSVYGCSLSQQHIHLLRAVLPNLKCFRCT